MSGNARQAIDYRQARTTLETMQPKFKKFVSIVEGYVQILDAKAVKTGSDSVKKMSDARKKTLEKLQENQRPWDNTIDNAVEFLAESEKMHNQRF